MGPVYINLGANDSFWWAQARLVPAGWMIKGLVSIYCTYLDDLSLQYHHELWLALNMKKPLGKLSCSGKFWKVTEGCFWFVPWGRKPWFLVGDILDDEHGISCDAWFDCWDIPFFLANMLFIRKRRAKEDILPSSRRPFAEASTSSASSWLWHVTCWVAKIRQNNFLYMSWFWRESQVRTVL